MRTFHPVDIPLKPRTIFRVVLIGLGVLLICLCVFSIYVLSEGLPSLEELENPKPELATRVLSADGEVIDEFYLKRRTYMPFDSIPRMFINALIATEDREFYNHWGIHGTRILKAFIKNIVRGRVSQGASTITQQLARNLYSHIGQERTLSRKIREAVTAVQIERTYTKNEILELYTNTVYFGRGAHGLQVAAEMYFNKTPQELSIPEIAFLVGILQRPALHENLKNPQASINRRNVVLYAMMEEGYISAAQYERYKAVPIVLTQPEETTIERSIAPHFVEMIRQQLTREDNRALAGVRRYDLFRDGLVIYTTLNARMQQYANQAVEEHLKQFQKDFQRSWRWEGKEELVNELVEKAIKNRPQYIAANPSERKALMIKLKATKAFVDSVKQEATRIQVGFAAIEAATGEIRAMVGSSIFGKQSRYTLNRVTQIRRQPGSSFKPFVYAAALDKGLTPYTTIESGWLSHKLPTGKTWEVAGSKSGGLMTLATALKFSINTVAARLILEYTSPNEVIRLARRCGIKSGLMAVPSLALGSGEVSPMEMIAAFTVFPNEGMAVEPYAIERIEDRFGNVLYDHTKQGLTITDAMNPRVARLMTGMMKNVVNGGTASRIRNWFPYEVAGKTGTTNDFADAWFVGYTPQIVAGVWTGFDDQRIKFTGWYGQGGSAAAPIWGRFMQKVYKDPLLGYDPKRRFKGIEAIGTESLSISSEGTVKEDGVPLENAPSQQQPADSTGQE
ncbi:MAG: PBP1A family penicillin-binding protein [Bacteroidota bacterium]|nr:PBP1A family penicillin-binding protein [Candidatus Kapabacteria bacterium]MDW8220293.1 PBP1A family penicillin-binding protein [Bacteroidota bacterium]